MTAIHREPIYSDEMVAAISQVLGDGLGADQIAWVLSALDMIALGDPVGTVRIRDDTGQVAVRVQKQGVIQWRVISQDGSQYNDMSSTLDWRAINEPAPVEVEAAAPPVQVQP